MLVLSIETFRIIVRHARSFAVIVVFCAGPVELIKNIVLSAFDLEKTPRIILRTDLVIELFVMSFLASSVISYYVLFTTKGKAMVSAALFTGLRRWPAVFLAILIVRCASLAGFVLLIFPGLFVWSALALVVPMMVSTPGLSLWEAIKKSYVLTRGQRMQVLGAMLIYSIFPLGIAVALRFTANFIAHWAFQTFLDTLTDYLGVMYYILLAVAWKQLSKLDHSKEAVA